MAMNKPPDLNQQIAHENILASVDVAVKQHLPTVTTCPFCRQELLSVHVSHVAGGRWYSCAGCAFRGDSIEFYHKAHGLPDIRDTIFELVAKGYIPMTRDELTTKIVNDYITGYIDERKRILGLFNHCCESMKELDKDKYRLLQELQLWDGFNAGRWHEKLKRFVGIGARDTFVQYGFKIPKRCFKVFLVCPFYDVPGRISSMMLYGIRGRKVRIYPNTMVGNEDGLMMMDSLVARNKTVYAVRDPFIALHLQRLMANMSDIHTLPIVVYGLDTNKAWQSVHAQRVIFWGSEPDYTMFTQSKQHPRACIATQPKLREPGPAGLKGRSLPEITTGIRDSAVSWATTIKQFMLKGEFWEISDFMVNLSLSATDIQRIYDVCSSGEKQVIQKILGHTSKDRYVYIGNMQVSESDDGWWIKRGADRELGCDAVIRIERAVHVVDTKENFYEGVVIFKGQEIRFSAPVNEMEKKPADWLRTLLMDHVGVLRLSRALGPHLVEVAKQLHEPQYVRRSGRIGWNRESRSYIFPNFSISDGMVDSSLHAKVLNTAEVPAGELYAPSTSEGDWDLALQPDHANAAIWAGLACFMGNMLAPAIGTKPQPIGMVGGAGSIGCIIGEHLVKELGMRSVTPRIMKHPLDELNIMTQRHDYPVWLDVASKNRKPSAYLLAEDSANLLMHLVEGEAAALGVGESWVFVHAPRIIAQSKQLPSLKGALAYLAWLQRNGFELPNATSYQQSVLLSLKEWAFVELQVTDEGVFAQAANMLRTFDSVSVHRRLMHLIFWMLSNQKLKMNHESFYEDLKKGLEPQFRSHVVFDDAHQKCHVKLSGLRTALVTARLPSPDYNNAIRSFASAQSTTGFESTVDGFVISQEFWDAEVRRWRKTRT